MSNNNISLYTLKPTSSTSDVTVLPTTLAPTINANSSSISPSKAVNYNNPLRLKISIPDKSTYFSKYNIPNSLPINGYMYYKHRKGYGTVNIYPIQNSLILSQSSNVELTQTFDINSTSYNFLPGHTDCVPVNAYLDFSGFNKITYNYKQYQFTYYRVAVFGETKKSQLNTNPYRYINGIKPSTVMMKNLNWSNDTTENKNYIGINWLYGLVLANHNIPNYNQPTHKLYRDSFLSEISGMDIRSSWIDSTKYNSESSTVLPVSWSSNTKPFLYFDSSTARVTINGFKNLWYMSQFERANDNILNNYYSNANNISWISQLSINNSNIGRFNPEKYFLIYDTMPIQYYINNTKLFLSNVNWVDAAGKEMSTCIPFNFSSDKNKINQNLRWYINFNHVKQNLSGDVVRQEFNTESAYLPEGDDRHNFEFNVHSFQNSTKAYLDSTPVIQYKKYDTNPQTYLGFLTYDTIYDNNYGDNTLINVYITRYSNVSHNISSDTIDDGTSLLPLKYHIDSTSNVVCTSYVNYKLDVDVISNNLKTGTTTSKTVTSYNGCATIFSANINKTNQPYTDITYTSKYVNLHLIDRIDPYNGNYTISSVNPKVSINIAYNKFRVYFKYNHQPCYVGNFINTKTYKYVYNTLSASTPDNIITSVLENTAVVPNSEAKYYYKDNQYSYLEYTTYANCYGKDTSKTDTDFYNTHMTFSLLNELNIVTDMPETAEGKWCYIYKNDINGKAIITEGKYSNEIKIDGINWYNNRQSASDITFELIIKTLPPKKSIEYIFEKSDTATVTLSPNSVIASSNGMSLGYVIHDRQAAPYSNILSINNGTIQSSELYLNSGFYTDNYEGGSVPIMIFKSTTTSQYISLPYYSDDNCDKLSTIRFNSDSSKPMGMVSNDGGFKIKLTNNVSNPSSDNLYAYFNTEDIISNYTINILPNDNPDQNLFNAWKSAYNTSKTSLFIDNKNESILEIQDIYNYFTSPIYLKTKFISNNLNVNCLYGQVVFNTLSPSQETTTMPSVVISNNNHININNIDMDTIINTSIPLTGAIRSLNTISFGGSTNPLQFSVSAHMPGMGDVNYGTIKPNINTQYIDLTSTNSKYVGLDNTNEFINNRFLNMNNKHIPSRDILHESLKTVAEKYECKYLNVKYDANTGIDIYLHPRYVGELVTQEPITDDLVLLDCTHWYSKDYENKFTKHYIYDNDLILDNNILKDLQINNIYYNIKNDTTAAIIIDDITYNTGDTIHISANGIQQLTVYDLIRLSQVHESTDFRTALLSIYEADKTNRPNLLSAVINSIKVSDESKYSLQINTDWLNNDNKIELSLSKISNIYDYDKKYNIINDYSLANINLSDIITVNNNNLIYLEPIYLGFDNERFDIFNTVSTNDNDKYNPDWSNLLTFIDTSTDYKLDSKLYTQMQITSFYVLNFVQANCKLLIDDDYTNITEQDSNVIWNGNVNGTDELKNIYNLYVSDDKKLKTLTKKINNSTKFKYKISLSNYTFVLNCKLFKTANTPEKDGIDISFKFTLGNSDITTEYVVPDNTNTINFGTFYITDKQLAYIKNDQPGYLWFDPISNDSSDDYEVRITFWDENQKEIKSTAAGTIVIKNGIAKKWNMIEYINNNINKDKKVNYISINYIKTSAGTEIEKYVLKPKV